MINENDNIDDETGVAALLGSLKRVEAPGDLEFGVRARIAKGRPVVTPWFMRPAMAGGVLGVMLVLVLGSVYFYRATSAANVPLETLASEKAPIQQAPASDVNGVLGVGRQSPAIDQEIASGVSVPQSVDPVKPLAANANSSRDSRRAQPGPGGNSFVEAGMQGERRYPRGIAPNARVNTKPRDFDRPATIAPADVLGILGAKTADEGGELRVTSVGDNTAAAKAGLKPGDVIRAVDKRPVTAATRYKGQFSVRSVTVTREGASVEIDLRPKN